MRDCSWIAGIFENIRPDNFKCCSDRTDNLPHNGYNCIAWAAGKTDKWWWPVKVPGAFWPIPIDPIDALTIENFVRAFETEGFLKCRDGRFENGFEKIAIYVDGSNEPTHAARSLPSGVWTSKLGKGEDIEHAALDVLQGRAYGAAMAFLKRPNPLYHKPNKLETIVSWLVRTWRGRLKANRANEGS